MMLLIYGPTTTGKTDLAIKLAKKYRGEIISADSRQVYKGLDIGTGKVSFNSKVEKHKGYWIVDGIKINGFDLVNPGQQFTVADFLKFAHSSMIQIIELKKLPVIVGGTGFYVKSAIDGIDSIGIPADQKLRRKLERLSAGELYQKLSRVDQNRAQNMNQSDRANPRRLIRAIEIAMAGNYYVRHSGVATTTIRGLVSRKLEIESRSYRLRSRMTNTLVLGLTVTNDYLYDRADKWLQTRLEHGMIDEVKKLLDRKVDPVWLDNLGLEYRWITRFLLGKIDQNLAIERLKGNIHSFIRHQKTWFKKLPNIKLYDISKPNWQNKLEKTVKDWYNQVK